MILTKAFWESACEIRSYALLVVTCATFPTRIRQCSQICLREMDTMAGSPPTG